MTAGRRVAVLLAGLATALAASCNEPLRDAVPRAGGSASEVARQARHAARPEPADPAPRPAPRRLLPVDEGTNDPTFSKYRESLIGAVRARDEGALIQLVAPDIFLGFGGPEQGAGAFRTQWKLWSPRSAAWTELEIILTHGGAFREIGPSRRQFCAPYVYAVFPPDAQRFDLAVISPDTQLRTEPRDDAPVVRTLDYEIVKPALFQPSELNPEDDTAAAAWRKVETDDGASGYVRESDVRSPRGFRACFEQRDGNWLMTAFMSGD